MDPKDAIQTDVSANTGGTDNNTDTQQSLHPREAAMRDIMKNRLANFTQESGIEVKPSFETDADPDADPDDQAAEAERARLESGADAPAEDEQLAAQLEDDRAAAVVDPKTKVKVKIDGVEQEVTVEEMQREFQKGRTADRRLEEAARRARELEEREAQLAAQREQSAAKPAAKPEDGPLVDPTVAKQFTAALFDGDEEKAVAAFNAAVQSAVEKVTHGRDEPATQVDIDQITATVEQRFAVNSALKKSREDYPDMYADADIEALAAMKIRAKREAGLDFADALEETGREFAEKFGWKKPGRPQQTNSTTRDDKLKRKAELDHIERANVKTSTTETPPPTNSQVIAEMAKRRPGYGV